MTQRTDRDFVRDHTLGSRAADFWWRADPLGNLLVRRTATRGQTHAARARLIPTDELDALLAWMAEREWVPLGCVPGSLRAGTAPDGIGRFLVEQLGWPPADAPFASHLAAVLVAAEMWAWNGKRRGQAFRLVTADRDRLRAHYERRLAESAADAQAPPQPEPPAAQKRRKPGGHLPPQVDPTRRLRALGRALRARVESVSDGLHPVEKGARREAAVRDFLRGLLPDDLRVASGEIFIAGGGSSPQVDALIYHAKAPTLAGDESGSVIVPAESVLAAIEVKPLLRRGELVEAAASLRRVKALRPMFLLDLDAQPNPPAWTAVFAFDSVHPHRIQDIVHELDLQTVAALALDCVCMLDRGIVYRYPGLLEPAEVVRPEPGGEPSPLLCHCGPDALAHFYIQLYEQLVLRARQLPDLRHYFRGLDLDEPRIL